MKLLSKVIAKAALISAKKAAGQASQWYQYQPREPKELKNMIKK